MYPYEELPQHREFIDTKRRFLQAFNHFRLGPIYDTLRRWHEVPIHYPLLMAAVHFWDPTTHLFRFGLDELCPTYEEFAALLGLDPDIQFMATPYEGDQSARDQLGRFLNLSKAQCRDMIVQGRIDLVRIMEFFLSHACTYGSDFHSGCLASVFLVFFSGVLLQTGTRFVDLSVVGVCYFSWKNDWSPVHIVLAETLNGLDDASTRGLDHELYGFFRGSPRLLFMWLCERFRLVAPPRDFSTKDWFYRTRVEVRDKGVSELREFLARRAVRIRWHLPWLRLNYRVRGSSGSNTIRLRGLTQGSFYLPGRLSRQFNLPQIVPYPPPLAGATEELKLSRRNTLTKMWHERRTFSYSPEEQGIETSLEEDDVRDRVAMLMNGRVNDPLHMLWFREGWPDTEVTPENIITCYQIYDYQRLEYARADPIWLPSGN